MKNILIIGAARSGKSTLAKMIHKRFGHSLISVDSFITAFQSRYPEIGFAHHSSKNYLISAFVESYVDSIIYNYPEINFVVEGYHIKPDAAVKYFSDKNFEIIVLGYPQLTAEEAYDNTKKYENKFDYTAAINKEDMLSLLERHIKYAKLCQEQCTELGIPFYDTSYNRNEIFASVIKHLETISND